jgi:hypothetical protein
VPTRVRCPAGLPDSLSETDDRALCAAYPPRGRTIAGVNASNEATLGVVLEATATPAEVTVAGERLSVIGYVWEPATELVGVDSAGAVWSYSPDDGSRVPMNSSVETLQRFLDLFAAFFGAAEVPAPTTYTAEQLAEKLAALRRGEIQPAAAGPSDRKARVKQLKKALREVDKPAVKAEWWQLVLEQIDDGIL